MYEVNRDNFNKIIKKYEEYVELYTLVNGGSREGLTPFSTFYWRYTFHVRYQDNKLANSVGN